MVAAAIAGRRCNRALAGYVRQQTLALEFHFQPDVLRALRELERIQRETSELRMAELDLMLDAPGPIGSQFRPHAFTLKWPAAGEDRAA